MCEEVTLEIFEERFMPRIQSFMSKSLAKKLSPTFIWSEIMSVIKGGLIEDRWTKDWKFRKFMTKREYRRNGSKWLTEREQNTIYYIFLQYERWKLNVHAFDFLDVVNHVLSQGYYSFKNSGNILHSSFMIIDEV